MDNWVLQCFVVFFDICSHVYQVVVEKKLMRERKLTRHDLGRENFVSEVSTLFPWNIIFVGQLFICFHYILSVYVLEMKRFSVLFECLILYLMYQFSVQFISSILSSYKQVLKWKDQYGGTILNQLRRLGASLDWSREVTYLFILVGMAHDWTMHSNVISNWIPGFYNGWAKI